MNARTPLDWDLGNVPPGIPWGGVDEAGRGAWAGPVVAACAVLDGEAVKRWGHVLRAARDSKKLSPDKRAALALELKTVLAAWAVAEVDAMAIDRENILEATLKAMRQAVAGVAIRPVILFVDGDRAPRTGLPERLVIDGDTLSCAVACASILAKTHRDAIMRGLDEVHPGWSFASHKGYGTPAHRTCLEERGASPVHRISYAPVAALQRPDEARFLKLAEAMDACVDTQALQHWLQTGLCPAYGALRLAWIESLRLRYAAKLASLSGSMSEEVAP